MKSLSVTIQMKATEQYFPVVLFITLYKVFLTFETVSFNETKAIGQYLYAGISPRLYFHLTIQVSIAPIQVVARAHKARATGCHSTGRTELCHVITKFTKFTCTGQTNNRQLKCEIVPIPRVNFYCVGKPTGNPTHL